MLAKTRERSKKWVAMLGLLSAEFIVIIVVFIISLAAFSYLVKQIFIDHQQAFDFKVFHWLAGHTTPFHTSTMEAITFLGTHKFLIPANLALTGYFLFIKKHKWHSIKVAAIALSSTAMMFLLKNIFSRHRPLIPLLKPALGFSFPSGHSMMSFSFYGLLIYLCYKYIENKILKWFLITGLFLLILSIGFSRIYLRVHYASDVLAGFSVGIAWLIFSVWLLNKIESYCVGNLSSIKDDG
jgi:undecaprenyl-diphosphatase